MVASISQSPIDITASRTSGSGDSRWTVVSELETGRSGITVSTRSDDHVPAEGWSISESHERSVMAAADDPLSAAARGNWHYRLSRPGLDADVRAESRFRATADEFLVDLGLVVEADGEPFAERRWSERIPRDGV